MKERDPAAAECDRALATKTEQMCARWLERQLSRVCTQHCRGEPSRPASQRLLHKVLRQPSICARDCAANLTSYGQPPQEAHDPGLATSPGLPIIRARSRLESTPNRQRRLRRRARSCKKPQLHTRTCAALEPHALTSDDQHDWPPSADLPFIGPLSSSPASNAIPGNAPSRRRRRRDICSKRCAPSFTVRGLLYEIRRS